MSIPESASDWYDDFGAHVTTRDAGEVCVQTVDYDWLTDVDDAAVAARVVDYDDRISEAEALDLVALARSVRAAAIKVAGLLARAEDAIDRGFDDVAKRMLDRASAAERRYGDDPATSALARSDGWERMPHGAGWGRPCEAPWDCDAVHNPASLTTVEWMPEHARESHRAAGGAAGQYPLDGSVRLRVCCHCTGMLVDDGAQVIR